MIAMTGGTITQKNSSGGMVAIRISMLPAWRANGRRTRPKSMAPPKAIRAVLPTMRPPQLWASKIVPTPKKSMARPSRVATGAHHACTTARRRGARSPRGTEAIRWRWPTRMATTASTSTGTAPALDPMPAATAATTTKATAMTRRAELMCDMAASIRCVGAVRMRSGMARSQALAPTSRSRSPNNCAIGSP